jgi:putative redox protein
MESTVTFTNDANEVLKGTLHRPSNPHDGGVVFGHCFTCSRHTTILREIAGALASAGFYALRFDFSGNGQSEGRFDNSTYSKQVAEMKTAAAYLAGQGAARLGFAGHSLGAVVSILAAAETDDLMGVVALAGRLSGLSAPFFLNDRQKKELTENGRVFFESRGRSLMLTEAFFSDAESYHPLSKIPRMKTPLLVIHGDADEIVPVSEAHRLDDIDAPHAEKRIIAGADHMFTENGHRAEIVETVVGWFTDRMS